MAVVFLSCFFHHEVAETGEMRVSPLLFKIFPFASESSQSDLRQSKTFVLPPPPSPAPLPRRNLRALSGPTELSLFSLISGQPAFRRKRHPPCFLVRISNSPFHGSHDGGLSNRFFSIPDKRYRREMTHLVILHANKPASSSTEVAWVYPVVEFFECVL